MVSTGTYMADKTKFFEKGLSPTQNNLPKPLDMFHSDEVKYSWTNNKSEISEYTKLIDDSFAEEINFSDSYKKINIDDLNSKFFIGKVKGKIVGGIRLSIHDQLLDNLLPTETQGIRYKELMNDIDLNSKNYCELTRYGVHKDYRNSRQHYMVCLGQCAEIMKQNNIEYLFIPSSLSRVRLYNTFAQKFFDVCPEKQANVRDSDKYSKLSFSETFAIGVYKIKNSN